MMRWLIPLGLGAAVAGLIVYEKNKKPKSVVDSGLKNQMFSSTSPGQPQPPAYRTQQGYRRYNG